jgi:hypothetical protein
MEEFAVYGLSGLLAVKYLVNAAKAMGMSTKFALPLAIAIGILLSAGIQVAQMYPAFALWFRVVMIGLFAALGAAEVYDIGARANIRNEIAEAQLWQNEPAEDCGPIVKE